MIVPRCTNCQWHSVKKALCQHPSIPERGTLAWAKPPAWCPGFEPEEVAK